MSMFWAFVTSFFPEAFAFEHQCEHRNQLGFSVQMFSSGYNGGSDGKGCGRASFSEASERSTCALNYEGLLNKESLQILPEIKDTTTKSSSCPLNSLQSERTCLTFKLQGSPLNIRWFILKTINSIGSDSFFHISICFCPIPTWFKEC